QQPLNEAKEMLLAQVTVVKTSQDKRLNKKTNHDNQSKTNANKISINGYFNEVTITEKDGMRTIESNGIPDHAVGDFPNAYNPISIIPIDHTYKMMLTPTALATPITALFYEFGVAVNGVPMDPNGPFYIDGDERRAIQFPFVGLASGWQYEGLSKDVKLGMDQNNAHVQPPGVYHYHGYITLFVQKRTEATKAGQMVLLGYAADGFPIYSNMGHSDPANVNSSLVKLKSSYKLKSGARPANPSDKPTGPTGDYNGKFVQDYRFENGSGDLDECNGRFGATSEYPQGIYYYVISEDWPYIPRLFKGTPHESFKIGG
ncbi:MAG: YHYH protein, partial [Flammeovirgaceae bacterium]